MQLVTFQTKIPEWTYNLQFALPKTFSNANYWLRNQLAAAYNLIFNYLFRYTKASKNKWRFTEQRLLNSIFFYFYIKRSKKATTAKWSKIERIYSNYFHLISKNYNLFRWFYTTLGSSSNLIRTFWMRFFTKKSLLAVSNKVILLKKTNVVNLRNRIRLLNYYNLIPTYNFKNAVPLMQSRAVFWKFNLYKSGLNYHKIKKNDLKKFGKPSKLAVIRQAKSSKNPNYKGKNYDPNYKWKKKLNKKHGLFKPLFAEKGNNRPKKHFIKQS
jgi:hypothetical protein